MNQKAWREIHSETAELFAKCFIGYPKVKDLIFTELKPEFVELVFKVTLLALETEDRDDLLEQMFGENGAFTGLKALNKDLFKTLKETFFEAENAFNLQKEI